MIDEFFRFSRSSVPRSSVIVRISENYHKMITYYFKYRTRGRKSGRKLIYPNNNIITLRRFHITYVLYNMIR